VVPLAAIGRDYVVDPARDLVPVCANCHAMLHLRTEVLSVGELKIHLSERRVLLD
jgi:5-methylcytosine-specific restriction protein A